MVSSANNTSVSGGTPGGGVILISNVYNLGDRDMPAAPIRKQTSLNMTFSATLLPTHRGGRRPPGPTVGRRLSARQGPHTRTPGHRGLMLHIHAEPPIGRLWYFVGYDEQQTTWTAEFSSRYLTRAPSGFSIFEGAIFALGTSGNEEH
ncbi:hypothetical protein DL770_010041 [Monosporascus sp. CRB-9-2]|nr:hypothetical protein DL770_010041 [Monosporascus sp. CRB-9-2]